MTRHTVWDRRPRLSGPLAEHRKPRARRGQSFQCALFVIDHASAGHCLRASAELGCGVCGVRGMIGKGYATMSAIGMSVRGMSVRGMIGKGYATKSAIGMSVRGMSVRGMSVRGMSVRGMSVRGMSVRGMIGKGYATKSAIVTPHQSAWRSAFSNTRSP